MPNTNRFLIKKKIINNFPVHHLPYCHHISTKSLLTFSANFNFLNASNCFNLHNFLSLLTHPYSHIITTIIMPVTPSVQSSEPPEPPPSPPPPPPPPPSPSPTPPLPLPLSL